VKEFRGSRSTRNAPAIGAMCVFLVTLLSSDVVFSQISTTVTTRTHWKAQWISFSTAALREPGVFHFRKILQMSSKPSHFVVHVSADNRFLLFVNGQRVGEGPARGDLAHWRYETFDLAPFLREGKNVIASTVWQFGIYAPLAQVSDRLAFLLEGDAAAETILNTDGTWQVESEPGHKPKRPLPEGMWQYWAAGPGEHIDGNNYDWDWKDSTAGPNSHWVAATPAIRESINPNGSTPASGWEDSPVRWRLVPDQLPPMEYSEVSSGTAVRADLDAAKSFPSSPTLIPPHTKASIVLDHSTMVSGYPELTVSGGKGAQIEMVFTEALYDAQQKRANRNEVANRVALGLTDEFLADGGSHRTFRPLWWRTWRYVELKVETADEALRLEEFHTFFSAYPFMDRGKFQSSDPALSRIRDICWRTARIDAHETYMDTAVWEQLQYIGDTRLQALISYTVSGDDRLARQALQAFDDSRIPEGITQSRYPSSLIQHIPPFSLLYINMLHDFWMYRPDPNFVAGLLPGTRPILAWFLAKQRPDGMLSSLPGWTFIDTPAWVEDFPRRDEAGRSSVVTLQMIGALQAAADLEQELGDPLLADRYRKQAESAATGVFKLCWNRQLGLLADTPAQNSYSQHANLTAVLFDVIPKANQADVMRKVLAASLGAADVSTDKLAKVSLFFQFYLARALEHVGLSDSYCDLLQPWRQMLAMGLTTTPEYSDPSRSDTHAWSAHPAYDFATIVAGIRPGSPGFATVRIEPSLGKLQWVEASMPHPRGTILVRYHKGEKTTDAAINLPDSVSGTFAWKGQSYPLHPGEQTFQLP
jgi:alpha-L-rhamnosidase